MSEGLDVWNLRVVPFIGCHVGSADMSTEQLFTRCRAVQYRFSVAVDEQKDRFEMICLEQPLVTQSAASPRAPLMLHGLMDHEQALEWATRLAQAEFWWLIVRLERSELAVCFTVDKTGRIIEREQLPLHRVKFACLQDEEVH